MATKRTEVLIQNKKASHDYFFVQSWEAGVKLSGTEVKSIRNGQANLTDSYCYIKDGEMFVKNIHISEYKQGGYANHEPRRERKLLLKKSEIAKIQTKAKEKGTTIIPVKIYFNQNGFAKIEIALARGKKLFDKRETLKENEAKREMDRAMKGRVKI